MKQKLALVSVCGMLVATIFLSVSNRGYDIRTVSIGGATVRAFVADKPEKQSKGLGGRRLLGADEGMLFVFDSDAQYGFWMKDMKFAIDIIWIDDGKIVDIAPNVPPPTSHAEQLPSYLPRLPADTVVEVNAGYTQGHGVRIGDTVSISGS